MADDQQKIISADKLKGLLNSDFAAQRVAAEERGSIAQMIKQLSETDHLDKMVYRAVKAFAKLPDGKREHALGVFQRYVDMLELVKQRDMFENIAMSTKPRTDQEKELDLMAAGGVEALPSEQARKANEAARASAEDQTGGEADVPRLGDMVRPGDKAGKKLLTGFMSSLKDAASVEAVRTGVDRFAADHPYLAGDAGQMAASRIREIETADSGGEDLRSTAQREAEPTAAIQDADTAKRSTRRRTEAKGDAPVVH